METIPPVSEKIIHLPSTKTGVFNNDYISLFFLDSIWKQTLHPLTQTFDLL